MSKAKLFIVGGNGVLGADLVSNLSSTFKVESINRDNYNSFAGEKCDVLINANGNSKRFWANKNRIEDFKASTLSVYNTLIDFKFNKYIYISSSDVYFDHGNPNFAKEELEVKSELLSPYGLHKYLSECIIKNSLSDYVILRSSLILGDNMRKGPIYDLLNNKPLFISSNSRLQMITTSEIANIVKSLIEKKVSNEVFNMGGIGAVDFGKMEEIAGKYAVISSGAEKQVYEMNVKKLLSIFRIKTSIEYLTEYMYSKKI